MLMILSLSVVYAAPGLWPPPDYATFRTMAPCPDYGPSRTMAFFPDHGPLPNYGPLPDYGPPPGQSKVFAV